MLHLVFRCNISTILYCFEFILGLKNVELIDQIEDQIQKMLNYNFKYGWMSRSKTQRRLHFNKYQLRSSYDVDHRNYSQHSVIEYFANRNINLSYNDIIIFQTL